MKKFLVILAVLVFAAGFLGCAYSYKKTSISQLKEAENSGMHPGGYIVEGYLYVNNGSICVNNVLNDKCAIEVYLHGIDECKQLHDHSHQDKNYDSDYLKRQSNYLKWHIDKTKKHIVYIDFYYSSYKRWTAYVNKIEGLMTDEEAAAAEALEKAIADAKKKEEEAKYWTNRNPSNLDRSLYKEIEVEDFSFDMVSGKLRAGSKVRFSAKFYTKPTGTSYKFHDVDFNISLNSRHNFVKYMVDSDFRAPYGYSQSPVTVYVTVQQTGKYGKCSVDIVDWRGGMW